MSLTTPVMQRKSQRKACLVGNSLLDIFGNACADKMADYGIPIDEVDQQTAADYLATFGNLIKIQRRALAILQVPEAGKFAKTKADRSERQKPMSQIGRALATQHALAILPGELLVLEVLVLCPAKCPGYRQGMAWEKLWRASWFDASPIAGRLPPNTPP